MKHHSIATIPADGIGPEVVEAGVAVLEALAARDGGFACEFTNYEWGSSYYKQHGKMMPDHGLEALKSHDTIFFGAVGAPDVPDHITLWGLRLPICQGFDQYANVRPTRILPGISAPLKDKGPGDLDWAIVRENSEGEYAGSLGVTPTANIDPEGRFPSMFEPIHGSAFDITGKGIANPVATFWTACRMLGHLGEADAPARLMKAIEEVCAAGIMTPDVGGSATTAEVAEAVINAIRGSNE